MTNHSLLLLFVFSLCHSAPPAPGSITIRGGPVVQKLPMSYMRSTPILTFDPLTEQFTKIENEQTGNGWVNPSSFSELYLPSDLPLPKCEPALGVCLANGIPRYIMPSLLLSLETPDKVWRNRGVSSYPRSSIWIDTFSPLARVDRLQLSCFGQSVGEVRFLEDIDGTAAWDSLLLADSSSSSKMRGMIAPTIPSSLSVASQLNALKRALLTLPSSDPSLASQLADGYHFIDISLEAAAIRLPKLRIKMFLTDIDQPQRLLELDSGASTGTAMDSSILDQEAVGELSISLVPVGAGGDSEFLPECYRDLYDAGNILLS